MEHKDYDRIISDNTPLVRSIAKRFVGRGEDYDDVFQAGCIGLYKAVLRFDESFGTAFSTYAVPMIIGEIRMMLRSGGTVKIGRGMKQLNAVILSTKQEIEKKSGKEARISDIAEVIGESPERIAAALTACAQPFSIDDNESGADATFDNREDVVDRMDIDRALSMLEPADRRLILLRYRHELSQSKTGQILEMSQVQVSRREKKVLEKLRSILA